MPHPLRRAALVLLLCSLVLPPASRAEPSAREETFRKLVVGRALHSEKPGVADAVQTLAQQGFLTEVLWLADNLDADQADHGAEPLGWWAVKRMKGKLHGAAKSWVKRQKKDGRRFDELEVKRLDWQPGKRFARLECEVTLKEGVISHTAFYKYELTLKIDTTSMDVVKHRWR